MRLVRDTFSSLPYSLSTFWLVFPLWKEENEPGKLRFERKRDLPGQDTVVDCKWDASLYNKIGGKKGPSYSDAWTGLQSAD